jgi:RNA polymerase sigma-70 factor (ECF subfamily)
MADPVMVVEHGAVQAKRSPLRALLRLEAACAPVEAEARSYSSPESLFMDQYEPLARALTLITHDSDAARDAVQEAFARLCRDWTKVSSYGRQTAWVRKVAVNVARDQLRKQGRQRHLFVSLDDEDLDLESHRPSFAEPPLDGSPELWKAVRELPEKQRVAVGLFYIADLNIAEVGAAMGISQGAVNRHLNRARNSLRTRMEA